jgi:GST-like protein
VLNNRLYATIWLGRMHDCRYDLLPMDALGRQARTSAARFKYFQRWFEELSARPAVQKDGGGKRLGGRFFQAPKEEMERRRYSYNQRARPTPA